MPNLSKLIASALALSLFNSGLALAKPEASAVAPTSNANAAALGGGSNGAGFHERNKNGNNNNGETPLLAPLVINSPLTITQAFPLIFVTGEMATSFPTLVKPKADVALEDSRKRHSIMNMEDQFAYLKKATVKALVDYDVHYELGDPRITQLTIDQINAKKMVKNAKGEWSDGNEFLFERVVRITDPNTIFKDPPKTTSEFNALLAQGPQVFADNDKAREIQRLLKEVGGEVEIFSSEPGHRYSDIAKTSTKRLFIAMQPLFDNGPGEKPILHNKEWVNAYRDSVSGKLVPIYGSIAEVNYTLPSNVKFDTQGQATPEARLNIAYHISDPLVLQNMMDHTVAMLEALGDGKTINDIVSVQPIEVHYADGSIMRLYYTDGRYNPNSLRVDYLNDAVATYKVANNIPLDPGEAPAKRKVEMIESHKFLFVDTYKPDLVASLALEKLIGDRWSLIEFFDNQFFNADGAGLGPVDIGAAVDRPMGGQVRDYSGTFARNKNAHVYVMQRPIDGLAQHSSAGAPDNVFLLHGKLVVDKVKIDDVLKYIIHDGSFNYSGHSANSESRMYFEVPAGSEWGRAIAEITPNTIANLVPQGYAVDGLIAFVRNVLAELTKHINLEIPLASVQEIVTLLKGIQNAKTPQEITQGVAQFVLKVRAIYALKTSESHRESVADFEAKMTALTKFGEDYSKLPIDPKFGANLTVQKFMSGIQHIVDTGEPPENIKSDFIFLLYGKVPPPQLDALIQKFWADEGINGPVPPDWKPNQPAVHTGETGVKDQAGTVERKTDSKADVKSASNHKVIVRADGRVVSRQASVKAATEKLNAGNASKVSPKAQALQANSATKVAQASAQGVKSKASPRCNGALASLARSRI